MSVSRRNPYGIGVDDDRYFYTKGGEYSLDGKNYIGEYHLRDGRPYTEPIASQTSKPLRRFYDMQDHYIYDKLKQFNVSILNYTDPVPYQFRPAQQHYSIGFVPRFFVEKLNTDDSYAIEIDQKQYDRINRLGGIDGGLYPFAAIEWKLTGRRDQIIEHNQNELRRASQKIPTVLYAIKNYLEFATITLV